MTEQERLVALGQLRGWCQTDKDIRSMTALVCRAELEPDIGHLARFKPEAFDMLYEEMEAMVGE